MVFSPFMPVTPKNRKINNIFRADVRLLDFLYIIEHGEFFRLRTQMGLKVSPQYQTLIFFETDKIQSISRKFLFTKTKSSCQCYCLNVNLSKPVFIFAESPPRYYGKLPMAPSRLVCTTH